MKKPETPPALSKLMAEFSSRLPEIFAERCGVSVRGKYLHWDELRRRSAPGDLSHEEWWLALKLARMSMARDVPLVDKSGKPFVYVEADPIPERLHEIDTSVGGMMMPDEVKSEEAKSRYLVSSLIEEAITSSQLEGAGTTRKVASEMIRSGRKPRDRGEKMILNKFKTMRRVSEVRDEEMSRELLLEIQRLITTDTLEDASEAGRFRRGDDSVHVYDDEQRVVHRPPDADALEDRIHAMCDFANGKTPDRFVPPVIRSIILHFWLAYEHPFIDGNGRTARALFYWSMLHRGFRVFELIPISRAIRRSHTQYFRAFLHTETDDNDLTYFIMYHLKVIQEAIDSLREFVARKAEEIRSIQSKMKGMGILNYREEALITHALRHPGHEYTIRSHRMSHDVAYQTARTDLFHMSELGLLEKLKRGRAYHFKPAENLEERLRALGE